MPAVVCKIKTKKCKQLFVGIFYVVDEHAEYEPVERKHGK